MPRDFLALSFFLFFSFTMFRLLKSSVGTYRGKKNLLGLVELNHRMINC